MRMKLFDDQDPKFPVQAFFNAINDNDFENVIESLSKRTGFCINDACCIFPGDLDPGEEVFSGVRFSLFKDEVVLDEESFSKYLKLACETYVQNNPTRKSAIDKMI